MTHGVARCRKLVEPSVVLSQDDEFWVSLAWPVTLHNYTKKEGTEMGSVMLDDRELRLFSEGYDRTREDNAGKVRGEFLRRFPKKYLADMTVDEYVIGHKRDTFCAWVEAKSRAWANIQGASSTKFGIYFGKTKSDATREYRYTKKFGRSKTTAFNSIRGSLVKLVEDGKKMRLDEIQKNPLSQMFKAKILSLYYPERFINICSGDHLQIICDELGMRSDMSAVSIQVELADLKRSNTVARDWSNPRFSAFLYQQFIRGQEAKSSSRANKRIDFRRLQDMWEKIGKQSEEYAISWERDRLNGLGYKAQIAKIQDVRDTPAKGFDYQSFTTPTTPRYIEVKSLGFDYASKLPRFFLSANERTVSQLESHRGEYYFYMVRYGKNGEPIDGVIAGATIFQVEIPARLSGA